MQNGDVFCHVAHLRKLKFNTPHGSFDQDKNFHFRLSIMQIIVDILEQEICNKSSKTAFTFQ